MVGDGAPAVPASDLTLYIGLAVAFLVFVLVVFVIVRLLHRKRSGSGGGYVAAGNYSPLPYLKFLSLVLPMHCGDFAIIP